MMVEIKQNRCCFFLFTRCIKSGPFKQCLASKKTRKGRAHTTSAISVVPPGTESNTPELCGTESGERFGGNYIYQREMYALCRSHFNAIPSIILAAPLTPRPDAIWIVWSGVNLESYLHYLANKGAIQRSDVITADTGAKRGLMREGIDDTRSPQGSFLDFDKKVFLICSSG